MYNIKNVKVYRINAELKQDDIAKKLNISLTTYNAKERGNRQFTLLEARELSRIFGRTIDEIFFSEVRI